MKIVLTDSLAPVEKIREVKPDEIVLEAPTLEQIYSLVKEGYEPPNLEQWNGEVIMKIAELKISFPDVETIRCAIATTDWLPKPFHDIFKWFTNQGMDILIHYGFIKQGEEDTYFFNPLVMKMEYRRLENLIIDARADEIQNGRDFGAI